MGHRRFLPVGHTFRRILKNPFNGREEHGATVDSPSSVEVYEQVEGSE